MTAFRVFNMGKPLQEMVDDAFVTGVSAPITPTGLAILINPFSLFSSMMPVVFKPSKSRKVPKVFFWCLAILSA